MSRKGIRETPQLSYERLWQGWFASYVLDEIHLLACACYIEMNPVRAKLVKDPTHWTLWSSAFAHTNGGEDKLRENTTFNIIGK